MPIDLATIFATTALGVLTRPAAKDAYGKLKRRLFGSKLEAETKHAFRQGWIALQAAIEESVVLRPLEEEELAGFARHTALAHASAQLLEAPFEEISTVDLHEAMAGLALPDATPEHYDRAWAQFHRGFQKGAAGNLGSYLRSLHRLRQETREEAKLDLLRQLVANTVLNGKEEASAAWSDQPVVQRYLRALWADLLPLQLMGLGRKDSRRQDVPLSAVYTALDATDRVQVVRTAASYEFRCSLPIDKEGQKALQYRLETEQQLAEQHIEYEEVYEVEESYSRSLSALEAVSLVPRMVFLGAAGSGKSTFARYLALCLAGEALGKQDANLESLNRVAQLRAEGEPDPDSRRLHWSHGSALPLFVELRKFVRDPSFPTEGEEGRGESLLAYLTDDSALREAIRKVLEGSGKAILILDGLDETPASEDSRERLRQVITSFARTYPDCRFLVTCRPYAYEPDSPWRLDGAGFEPSALAPLDASKVEAFVRCWYRSLELRGQVEMGGAERRALDLLHELRDGHTLEPLAERPLMLTMMVDLHASGGGRFEGGRAEIYEQTVTLLLDRWNELRDIPGARSVASHLGLGVRRLRHAIESLAFLAHGRQGGEENSATEITLGELWEELDAHRPASAATVDQRRVSDYLHQRSGILVGESPSRFRFPHRSFQEFLAACHLLRVEFPAKICSTVQSDPALWRETFLLAAARASQNPYLVWTILEAVIPFDSLSGPAKMDQSFKLANLCARAVQENRLWEDLEPQHEQKLERIRRWAERSLESGSLPPHDRAVSGQVLGILGDRRAGTTQVADGLPVISWVEVPDTELALSRYPITSAQYQTFVEAGGYSAPSPAIWCQEALAWLQDRKISGPYSGYPENFLLPNHPRVGVSFWEAKAFSAWLSESCGDLVGLPTEGEWAAGFNGLETRFDIKDTEALKKKSNVMGVLGETTAVGAFPESTTRDGLEDMVGNVWEWCDSNSAGGDYTRDIRGGGWLLGGRNRLQPLQDWYGPGARRWDVGFRLVRRPKA